MDLVMSETYFTNPFQMFKVVLCLMCYVFGLTIFISGFIPAKVNKLHSFSANSLYLTCMDIINKQEVCQNMEFNSSYTKHYDKFVLIIIDALRADFIPSVLPNPEFDTSLPFTEALIKNKSALPFINQVHSPTVTMPRIKTLVTGGISNFIDILINFNAAELNEDNLLAQVSLKNMKSVFYGDDTWLKLFPSSFMRSDGTHSFFVSDFKEVDDNVTRHLPRELSHGDWDIMILHYLGVDHIGHSYGPLSLHMRTKLKEMDEVIKVIYSNLTKKPQIKSLIAICGDHGMTSGGNHGGITKSELLTPLIFINSNSSKYSDNTVETIYQVDFAVTISSLLGIPIPANSFGNIIPSVLNFSGLTRKQILNAAFYNLLQLYNVHKIIQSSTETMYIDSIKNTILKHFQAVHSISKESDILVNDFSYLLKLYMSLLNELKQNLLSTVSSYNLSSIIIGLISMWLSFICSVICFLTNQYNFSTSVFSMLSTIANRLNIFIISTLVLMCILFSIDLYILLMIPIGICMLNLLPLFIRFLVKNVKLSFMEKVCVLMFFLQVMSMFSSSFIEEEHQVWYFSINTILILYFIKCLFSMISYCSKNKTLKHQLQLTHLWDLVCLDKNSSDACKLLLLLVSHRILRSWNQTGNKWQHLPDVSDWLNKEENVCCKLFLVITSQVTVLFYLKGKQRPFTFHAMSFGSFCIFIYKCKNEYVSLFFKDCNVDLIFFSWLGYAIIIIITFSAIKLIVSPITIPKNIIFIDFISASVLLTELIGRAHNIPLIAATFIQEQFLNNVLQQGNDKNILKVSIYLQLAMCSFFYQGNSNSLSTIDLFSGYTGLLSYKPVIAGILITFNTYSAIILWLLLLIYRMLSFNRSIAVGNFMARCDIFSNFLAIVIYKLFVLAVYCIVMNLMKHHLFVLSVFTPKLFYETCHLIFFVIFIFLIGVASTVL